MHGNSQNPIITGDCANSAQRHPLYIGQNTTTLLLTPVPQSCIQRPTNALQPRTRGDMRVTERNNGRGMTRPSQNTAKALSESLRRSTSRNAIFWNGRLTKSPKTPKLTLSTRRTSCCSVSQKGTSGFAPCQTQGVRNRALIARFFCFHPSLGWTYGFGRMGPRKRAAPCGGSANPVRPARQICTLACWFTKNHKETCHV